MSVHTYTKTRVPNMAEVLAGLNRSGFLTVSSQAGYDGPSYDGTEHVVQHAAVIGFVTETTRVWLERGLSDRWAGVVWKPAAVMGPAGEDDDDVGPWVTRVDGEPYTEFGRLDVEFIELGFPDCHPAALAAVRAAYPIVIWDQAPGMNGLVGRALWLGRGG